MSRRSRVVVVTNDFPPSTGGIETFTAALVSHLPPDDVVVLTRRAPSADRSGPDTPYRVVRHPARTLLPTRAVAHHMREVVAAHGATAVWFASAAPLGLLAPAARGAGVDRVVASTHGHEVWWSRVPLAATALRRIAAHADALTYVCDFTRDHLVRALPPKAAGRLARLAPGVDPQAFAPDPVARASVRRRLGVGERTPVVLAVTRLVRRKGVDTLLRAWPVIRARHPTARLVVVGDGPDRGRLSALAVRVGGAASGVRLVGSRPWADVPAWYAAADVFALPVRTRLAGLEPEAYGICFLEAAASGLPVVAGRSGGTAEALVEGTTGALVDGGDPSEVADAIVRLLDDPDAARSWGSAGRDWVGQHRSWSSGAATLRLLLDVD